MKIKQILHPITAAFLGFLLAFGSIGCLTTAFGLELSPVILAQCCALTALFGCVLFSFRKGGWILLPILACAALYLWTKTDILDQLSRLCYDISRMYALAYGSGYLGSRYASDTTVLPLCVWGSLIALTAAGSLTRSRTTVPALFTASIPVILCLVVTNTVPSEGFLFVFLLGLILALLSQNLRRQRPYQAARLTWLLCIPVVLALTLLFAINPREGYDHHPKTEQIEEKAMQWVDKLPFLDLDELGNIVFRFSWYIPETVNLQNTGPNNQLAIRVMEVTTESDGILYLRGQDYDEYTGTAWTSTEAKTEEFTFLQTGKTPEPVQKGLVSIHTFTTRPIRYFPYYPVPSCTLTEGACSNTDNATDYVYAWRALPADFESIISPPPVYVQTDSSQMNALLSATIGSNYTYAADSGYLQLPEDTRVWATEYLATHLSIDPADNICTVANTIASLVRDSADYDLRTDWMPDDQADFARWFLEESDTGYCVHYATATTVLLRAAGIPARYVEGYMAEVTASQPLTVTEKDAHAWAEYFVPGFGWVMLESTAGAETETATSEPSPTTDQTQPSEEVTTAPSTRPEATTPSTTPSAPDRKPDSTVPSGQDPSATPQKTPISIPTGVTVSILLLAALMGQYPLRLRLRKTYLQTGTANARALKQWRFTRLLARLLRQTPPAELRELALRAKFSQHILTEEDLAAFDDFRTLATEHLRQRPWWQQLYHRLFWAAY